jgi:glycosyltransferase involved in cell wall biosynthesis
MPALKILIVCEHASNAYGGEAILPLNYFRFLTKSQHDVYLITHDRVKASILKMLEINQNHVFYVPDTWVHQFLNKCARKLPSRFSAVTVGFITHLLTQIYQWKLVGKIVKDKQIDLIHEPAPVSVVQPSAMFGFGVPVLIGPMNGGMSFPPAFQYMAGWSERIIYGFIRTFTSLYNLIIPGKFFADALLVANKRTQLALPKFRLGRVIELVENGVFSVLDTPKAVSQSTQINVLYVGRLIDLKMVDIAIDAVMQCKGDIKLTILGDGPLRRQLMQYAKTHANGKVQFLGAVPHAEINQHYDNADVFVLPSVRECGGAVVLEAMARGLPVIAVNWGGPADYITAETGFLIDPKSRAYMVEQFAQTIELLAAQPALRYKIGEAAIQRVKQHFTWDKKIHDIVDIYQKVKGKAW